MTNYVIEKSPTKSISLTPTIKIEACKDSVLITMTDCNKALKFGGIVIDSNADGVHNFIDDASEWLKDELVRAIDLVIKGSSKINLHED
ncbi:MAG: hypothetical protein JKY52_00130 [Flavobacteriales bacterium]|nr:hypothetical protein [Flavobacteriales bacterium]